MKDYKQLQVWEKSHRFAVRIYALTSKFPRIESYALVDQMRRAAISVPSNIAEGCGRNSDPELARFFLFAKGSANELDYQLLLSKELGYIETDDHANAEGDLTEIRKMLTAFILRVRGSRRST